MEKQPEINIHVQIPQAAFEELEVIRRSGATNMLDRPTVLDLAREWDLTAIADWIERVDTGTYGRLILQSADIIATDPAAQVVDSEPVTQANAIDVLSQGIDDERANRHKIIASLGKQASLTIADTYDTELMGV
jgi:hypothetical protein